MFKDVKRHQCAGALRTHEIERRYFALKCFGSTRNQEFHLLPNVSALEAKLGRRTLGRERRRWLKSEASSTRAQYTSGAKHNLTVKFIELSVPSSRNSQVSCGLQSLQSGFTCSMTSSDTLPCTFNVASYANSSSSWSLTLMTKSRRG